MVVEVQWALKQGKHHNDFVLFFIFRYFIRVDSINFCLIMLLGIQRGISGNGFKQHALWMSHVIMTWHKWWGIDWLKDFVIMNSWASYLEILLRLVRCLKFGLSKLVWLNVSFSHTTSIFHFFKSPYNKKNKWTTTLLHSPSLVHIEHSLDQ
jgi:hypothetical protein